MRQRLTFLLGLFLLATAAAPAGFAQQNSRVALLIGNAAYPDAEAPLKEPASDARALGDELKRRGFDVDVGENLKKEAMQRALDRFYGKINSSSTAVIFFSGFGIQSDRQSYMIPVDAQIWNESDVRRDGFSLDKVLSELASRGAQVKIAIIDASRRNPFERRFRSVAAGLAAITTPRGTVAMTSATPDTVVSDSSPPVFMTELIAELKVSEATIEQVFNRTRMDISRETKEQQVPWFSSSLEEDIAFGSRSQPATPPATVASQPNLNAQTTVTAAKPVAPAAAPAAAPAVSSPDPEAEARHDYVIAESLGTKQAWDDFVKKHPSGYYYDLAQQQIAELPPATAGTSSSSHDANPSDLAGFYRRGQRYAVNGEFAESIKDFDEVIRRDPKHAGALNNRCWVRGVIGDLANAMKDCDAALRIAPNYPDALDSRGMVNLKLGMLSKAIADYDAALRLDPKHASALHGRGIAKLRSGDTDGGKKDVDAAKAIQPTIADEFRGYGIR
jgi:uncharacterized caspase-like protein/Flp pilus assembly protein TadD